MERISTERAKELLALAEKAEPGPWSMDTYGASVQIFSGTKLLQAVAGLDSDLLDEDKARAAVRANGAFIVAARNDGPAALLDLLDARAQLRTPAPASDGERELVEELAEALTVAYAELEGLEWSDNQACPGCKARKDGSDGLSGEHDDACELAQALDAASEAIENARRKGREDERG